MFQDFSGSLFVRINFLFIYYYYFFRLVGASFVSVLAFGADVFQLS